MELLIAHVNYGLRGRESDKDQKFVEKLAQKYYLPMVAHKPDIVSKSNLENRLREIRYDFFERVRKEHAFDLVTVAHNLDDQAETFFLRLIRGSGLSGLSAMKFKTGHIIRPLLGTSRKEIMEYLKQNHLAYRIDKTNKESVFTRNKVRNQLIPYIEKRFNPNIKKTIFDNTITIADDHCFLEGAAKQYLKEHPQLCASELLELHPAIFRQVLLSKIREVKTNLKEIEYSHIEELEKALKSAKGKSQTVRFKGLKMTRKGDKVIIEKSN